MPVAIGAAVAAGVGLTAGTIAFAVVAFVVDAVISIVVSAAVSKLLGGAKKPASANDLAAAAADQALTVREPAATRRQIYGEARSGGVIVFLHATGQNLSTLFTENFVVPPAPHEITVSRQVTAHADAGLRQVISGDYGNEEQVYPFTEVSGTPGGEQYSRSGSTYTFAAEDAGRNVYITYQTLAQINPGTILWLVIVLAAHESEAIGDVYFDNELVQLGADGYALGKYAGGYAWVSKHLGGADQLANGVIATSSDGLWTVDHRLRGHTHLVVRLLGHPDLYPSGIPNITAIVRGRKVYDPRTGLSAWSQNAALCTADLIASREWGFGAAYGAEIDTAELIAAANICDEEVPLRGGGTERRYTCNGIDDSAVTLEDALPKFNSAMGGRAVWTGGKWLVRPAVWRTPGLTLDEGDLRGAVKVTPAPSRRALFNAVKGLYLSPQNLYQPADYPSVTNATYQSEDGDERIWGELDLPFTHSAATAQRVAKIELERGRQGLTVMLPCKLVALGLRATDTVMVDNVRLGWSGKPFEVAHWSFSIYEDAAGAPTLGIDLVLRETAAGVYDWVSGEETAVDLAPNTNLPNALLIGPPGLLEPVETLYETRDGRGVGAKVTLTVVPPVGGTAREYQFEYRPIAEPLFTVLPSTRAPSIDIFDVAPGIYDFRVKALNGLGISSPYSQVRKELLGLGGRPADVSGLTLQAISSLAVLQWTRHPDLDVRVGGRMLVRHSEAMSGATWEDSYSITDALPGDATIAVVPLKGGTYLVRAEDSSGVQSANAVAVTTKGASVLAFSTLGSVTEDPTFPGTKSGCVADSGYLSLSGAGMFDAIADFDAVGNLDAFGGFSGSATYTFSAGIDLGAVKSVQLVTELALSTVQTAALFDSRTDPLDDWLDWDGPAAGGVGDCVIEVRETDDNPAGSPTWSTWQRLVTADYEARAFQFRALMAVADPAYNVQISRLRAAAREVT